jgi:hypothetical protein
LIWINPQWIAAPNSRGHSTTPRENIMSKESKPTKKATLSEDSKPMKKDPVSNDSKPAEKSALSNDSKPTEKARAGETPVFDFTNP